MTQEKAIEAAEKKNEATITAPLKLGRTMITSGIAHTFDTLSLEECSLLHDFLSDSLSRHTRGDWGDVDHEDWETNDDAYETGGRILSAYEPSKKYPQLSDDLKIWIITEWDRSATTILFPSEY